MLSLDVIGLLFMVWLVAGPHVDCLRVKFFVDAVPVPVPVLETGWGATRCFYCS